MTLNSDFSKPVILHTDRMEWVPSPMAGVDRRMLDRIGDEVARATSIVRYAPGSSFSAHTHTGGEEFIVLEGVFQDEHGDYPAGTYVRNPPTTSHTPGAAEGCVIFVKLWQFDPDDRTQFRKDMRAELGQPIGGIATAELHKDAREHVRLFRLEGDATLTLKDSGGIEALILSGSVTHGAGQGEQVLATGGWLRQPDGVFLSLKAHGDGAEVWVKTGHLPFAVAPTV